MKAWTIITSVVERLAVITVANGYQTDIGTDVTAEPTRVEDGTQGVLVVSTDIQVPDATAGVSPQQRGLSLVIEARIPASAANGMAQAHKAIEDIERAIETMDALPGAGRGRVDLRTATFEDRPDGREVILATWDAVAMYRRDDTSS